MVDAGDYAAHDEMRVAGDGYYDERADHGGEDNREDFLAENAEASHQSHACGHEEKAEVAYEQVGDTVDLVEADDAGSEGSCEQQHAYDA